MGSRDIDMTSDTTGPDDHAEVEQADSTGGGVPRIEDIMQDLAFVPTWARPESDSPTFRHGNESAGVSGRERGPGTSRGPKDRRPRQEFRGERRPDGDRRGDRRGGGGRGRDEGPGRDRRRGSDKGPRRDVDVVAPHPHLDVAFIPVRERLGVVVRQLHMVKRAFPLHYLAGLFLDKPEHHLVKLEMKVPGGEGSDSTSPRTFFMATGDNWVSFDRKAVEAHVLSIGLEGCYDVEDVTVEPPSGVFQMVGRYRPTGEWLGPPNHHSFQENLSYLHRTYGPDLSVDAFRQRIEMVREPEAIEAWKQSFCQQKVYRRKEGGEDSPALSRADAEAEYLREVAPSMIQEVTRAVIPATVAMTVTDPEIRATIRQAWLKEDRFPLSTILALRAAFKHMRLHLFKIGRGETFATSIVPKPLDSEHAIEAIRSMVTALAEHPGWTRKHVLESLLPGRGADDPEVAELLRSLGWLIDKGHVMEFFNGALCLPGAYKQLQLTVQPGTNESLHDQATAVKPVSDPAAEEPSKDAVDQSGSVDELVEEARTEMDGSPSSSEASLGEDAVGEGVTDVASPEESSDEARRNEPAPDSVMPSGDDASTPPGLQVPS